MKESHNNFLAACLDISNITITYNKASFSLILPQTVIRKVLQISSQDTKLTISEEEQFMHPTKNKKSQMEPHNSLKIFWHLFLSIHNTRVEKAENRTKLILDCLDIFPQKQIYC